MDLKAVDGLSAQIPSVCSYQQMSTTTQHLPIRESGSREKEEETLSSSHGTCIFKQGDEIKRFREAPAFCHSERKGMTDVVTHICNPSTCAAEAGGGPSQI